jgi:hypothetical protein
MGYSRKDTATRSLSRLIEGVDFSAQVRESSGGRPSEEIRFSRDGFKQWGMLAGTDRGRQIRLYFIECEKRLQLGMNQPTALNQITDNLAQLSELVIGGLEQQKDQCGDCHHRLRQRLARHSTGHFLQALQLRRVSEVTLRLTYATSCSRSRAGQRIED